MNHLLYQLISSYMLLKNGTPYIGYISQFRILKCTSYYVSRNDTNVCICIVKCSYSQLDNFTFPILLIYTGRCSCTTSCNDIKLWDAPISRRNDNFGSLMMQNKLLNLLDIISWSLTKSFLSHLNALGSDFLLYIFIQLYMIHAGLA